MNAAQRWNYDDLPWEILEVLKIATWNVNGIRAREGQVLEWVEREQPDVICLQELKSTVAQVPAARARYRRTALIV